MIGLVARLQSYLREKAFIEGQQRISLPLFTLFLNPTADTATESVAIPDEADSYPVEAVNRLCAAFVEHGRVPYVQYLDAFAPGLTITLQLGIRGFVESLRLPVMYCTAGMLNHPPDVSGLRVTIISSESPLDEVKTNWNVNSRGFDPEPIPATDAIAEEFRRTLIISRAFTAYLHREPVAAGMFEKIQDGLTELVGITTLAEYRRQGISAALTATMTRAAFDSGVEVVFLIAGNEAATRLYERLGFRSVAKLLQFEFRES